MNRVLAIRAMSLYVPVTVVYILALSRPLERKLFAAGLMGFLWTLPALLALQLCNLKFGWWHYSAVGALWRSMPVDLYLGWCVLWGVVPVMAFRRTPIPIAATIFVALDLVLMPACRPVVQLGDRWLIGEAAAVAIVLLPSLLFARWTLNDTHLRLRALLHILTAAGLFLFLIPEIAFALRPGPGWMHLFAASAVELQLIALLGLPGISAVQEVATRGAGTPIPYDPPKRLVVSGFYRYIANPMQFSCAVSMIAWSGVLHNPWLALGGALAAVYSVGLANWDESEDLRARFGEAWLRYRQHIHPWRTRLRPWHDPVSPLPRLYIAETCGPCSQVRRWFESRGVGHLEIVAAEKHPSRALRRITYDPMDGTEPESGVRAFARGLEHIHLGWAFIGALLRLPLISHFVQLILDVSGFGPRSLGPASEDQGVEGCALP